jgi:hypothetical protein
MIYRYAVSTQWERQQSEGRRIRDFHSYCCCCAKRIGNMFALLSSPDGTPIIIAGPCWPFCVFVTFPLIIGISTLVIFFLILGDTFILVSETLTMPNSGILFLLNYSFQYTAKLDPWYLYTFCPYCPYFSLLCVLSGPWTHGARNGKRSHI